MAPGSARPRGGALRRARVSDDARRGVALHERRADRVDRSSGRSADDGAPTRICSGAIYGDVPNRAGHRERPILAGAVARRRAAGGRPGRIARDRASPSRRTSSSAYLGQLAEFGTRAFTALNTALAARRRVRLHPGRRDHRGAARTALRHDVPA